MSSDRSLPGYIQKQSALALPLHPACSPSPFPRLGRSWSRRPLCSLGPRAVPDRDSNVDKERII